MAKSSSADRRTLHFETIEDLLREIDQVVKADKAGRIEVLGAWTPGQILGHLAAWIEYGYEGYPMKPLPWPFRVLLRWQLKRYFRYGMPTGIRIPGVRQGTYGTAEIPTADAGERLRSALGRLQRREPAQYDSPAFGAMSDEERIRLNLAHAELHLSFLQFEAATG